MEQERLNVKDTNPKDSVGIRKAPMSTVSVPVLLEVGLGMMEGALKYGRHNYRVAGVRASVYYDAAMRHMMEYWEGQDIDTGSAVPIHNVSKAIAALCVLRDAMIQGKLTDDRPPPSPAGFLDYFNQLAGQLIDQFPNPPPAYTAADVTPVVAKQNITVEGDVTINGDIHGA